jgi:hypothetical protein
VRLGDVASNVHPIGQQHLAIDGVRRIEDHLADIAISFVHHRAFVIAGALFSGARERGGGEQEQGSA